MASTSVVAEGLLECSLREVAKAIGFKVGFLELSTPGREARH